MLSKTRISLLSICQDFLSSAQLLSSSARTLKVGTGSLCLELPRAFGELYIPEFGTVCVARGCKCLLFTE